MRLPGYLVTALAELPSRASGSVAAASRQLTSRYKTADFAAPAVRTSADRAAYLATRLPATFAANVNVFSELRRLAPQVEISSLLDLGAGPGTSLLAAAEVFPELAQATLLETDPQWLELGRQLAARSHLSSVRDAEWLRRDMRELGELKPHDLVVISYSLGELAPATVPERILHKAWLSAAKFLVVIEPGTRRGFAAVNAAHSWLISQQAGILAPCPHKEVCPMAAANDWCHFSQRLERSSEHRLAKHGSLGYEDEKFSYVIGTRLDIPAAHARIVRHPRKHSGHVQLELCTAKGVIEKRTVTRSNKEAYKRARQADWGDEWEE